MRVRRAFAPFVALVLLLAVAFSLASRLRRHASGETQAVAVGALAALIALGSAATFELSFLRHWVVILMFTVLGAIASLSSAHADTDGADSWLRHLPRSRGD